MKNKIVAVGEILWDLLPSGAKLGGAPANFIFHAHALGADAQLISRIGNDELGAKVLARLREHGVSADTIQIDSNRPTGVVAVEVGADGQPSYDIRENSAWDAIETTAQALHAIERCDAICFGTLAQRGKISRDSIPQLIASAPPSSLRILDVNIRQHYFSADLLHRSLELANALKLNDAELPKLAAFLNFTGNIQQQLESLATRFNLKLIAYTRGGGGSLLIANGHCSNHPGVPTKVIDTIGAGDSFTAAMTLGFLSGWPLDEINDHANRVAAFVCSQPGATPTLPSDLVAPFHV